MPFSTYRPDNWYWFVGADTDNVWSSARAMNVPISDADYVAWLANHSMTPQMASMAELEDTLRQSFPRGTPRTYAADARFRKASGGATVGGKPYLTDPVSRNTLGSAHDYAVANPGHITDWKLADGTFIKLDEPGLAHALQQIATFVQSCFSCESTLVTGIDGGTITTLAEIDAAFAAISNVFA
jgi:hypothetical protein